MKDYTIWYLGPEDSNSVRVLREQELVKSDKIEKINESDLAQNYMKKSVHPTRVPWDFVLKWALEFVQWAPIVSVVCEELYRYTF